MNHSEQRLVEAQRQHTEAIVTRYLHQLFQRLPMLSGFWLHPDYHLAEVVFTSTGCTNGHELYDQVTVSLVQLAEECPEAVHVMRGRTFARAIH
jgi:hypothetical protein